jgi:bud site selection protein 20
VNGGGYDALVIDSRFWGANYAQHCDGNFLFGDIQNKSDDRMGQPQARKSRKHTKGNHPLFRTRNYGRDIDQIHGDLAEKKKTLLQNTVIDEDKPGLGLWYCLECARWFVDESALGKHKTSKVHKRR